jgi:hypothetical protein
VSKGTGCAALFSDSSRGSGTAPRSIRPDKPVHQHAVSHHGKGGLTTVPLASQMAPSIVPLSTWAKPAGAGKQKQSFIVCLTYFSRLWFLRTAYWWRLTITRNSQKQPSGTAFGSRVSVPSGYKAKLREEWFACCQASGSLSISPFSF